MKVLVLDGQPPDTIHSGKSVRLVNLLSRIGRQHELHYLAITAPGESQAVPAWIGPLVRSSRVWAATGQEFWPGRYANWAAFRPYFHATWRYPVDFQKLSQGLRRLVADERIELIHCFSVEAAQFLLPRVGCPWIMDPADAMALHLRRRAELATNVLDRLRWDSMTWRLANYERDLVRHADATIYVSAIDAACYATTRQRTRVHVIPNGVDTQYFSPYGLPGPQPSRPTILFTGHMSYGPNHDAAMDLLDRVLPAIRRAVPGVVVQIVGADPQPALKARHDGQRVIVTGWVEDLRPWMAAATVYACPMRLGAGIKNKLLEAMAMGRAIVTTTRGADGLAIQPDVHAVVENDMARFSQRVIELLGDPERGRILGDAARTLVVGSHSWEAAAVAYERLYRALREAPRRPRAGSALAASAPGATA